MHERDSWYHDGFKIFYIELKTKTDCEYCESFFIDYYQTYKYFNVAKSDWGSGSFINAENFTWVEYKPDNFKNEFVKKRKQKASAKKDIPVLQKANLAEKQHDDKYIAAKIPQEIILNKSLGKKRVLFYINLYLLKGSNNEITFSKSDFTISCGYSVNNRNGKIGTEITRYVDLLDGIYIDKVKCGRYLTTYRARNEMDNPLTFGMVYYHEYKKIIEILGGVKGHTALLLLSYVRLKMYRPKKGERKPEYFFSYVSRIEKETGLSSRMIYNISNTLDDLDIIYCGKMPRYLDKYNHWHTGITYFVNKHRYRNGVEDVKYDWNKEASKTEKYIRNTQMAFLNISNK